jgi:hypothetical protein
MRTSRRAGLTNYGVLWEKYKCERVKHGIPYGRSIRDHVYDSGNDPERTFGGTTDYGLSPGGGPCPEYFFYPSGEDITLSVDNPGTAYNAAGNDPIMHIYTMSANGDYTFTIRTVYTEYEETWYEYEVGEKLRVVRATEGEYPDSHKGYTYVTTSGGYTIMKNGETYYAYKLKG